MGKLFGTDGIRGVANTAPLTAEMALAIGRATAHICKRHDNRHRIVIGKDTRLSGYMIENALTAGICSMGVDVLLVGPMPTPGIAFTTHSMRADAGMVISASHNPYQDNGIKIFSRDGYKLSDKLEEEVESLVSTGRINDIRPTAENVGKAHRIDDAIGRYIVFCKNTFPDDVTLDGIKLVLDCANGATYKVAPIIFSELGAQVIAIHNEPDGKNINENCGSQHTGDLMKKVREVGADAGLAFDGDGDRLIAVDENGQELSGDHIIAVCAKALKERGELKKNLVVVTAMSNFGLRVAFDKMHIHYKDADVGDRNVLEMMVKYGAVLGGEQSGHIIFRNHHTTGDGIISALQLLAVMKQGGSKMSDLSRAITLMPQRLVNIVVKDKPPVEGLAPVQEAIQAAEKTLGRNGRVLVRYSGTQLLCRVMVEGPTRKITDRLADSIVRAVRKAIA
ncbi:MAG: phosphoglucosamine mutase [bacterium]